MLLLALPASVAVWSGWVGIGQLTGFGQVRPLPGIWDSLHIDSAVTLPVGVEAYAAYALHAWLAASATLTARTRRFAKWSAIGSLLLGMAGQVAYHLLTEDGATRAPWGVTTVVACLPVLILGMAAGLTHLIHADAATSSLSADLANGPEDLEGAVTPGRLAEAQAAASRLIDAGQRVSRRSLRAAGMHGSNAELNDLARVMSARPDSNEGRGLSHQKLPTVPGPEIAITKRVAQNTYRAVGLHVQAYPSVRQVVRNRLATAWHGWPGRLSPAHRGRRNACPVGCRYRRRLPAGPHPRHGRRADPTHS